MTWMKYSELKAHGVEKIDVQLSSSGRPKGAGPQRALGSNEALLISNLSTAEPHAFGGAIQGLLRSLAYAL
jgi:hypothetical protein